MKDATVIRFDVKDKWIECVYEFDNGKQKYMAFTLPEKDPETGVVKQTMMDIATGMYEVADTIKHTIQMEG